MHIRAITRLGGAVLGERDFMLDRITPPEQLSAVGGPETQILNGVEPVRPATPHEWGKLPVLGFWGFEYIRPLAEVLLMKSTGGAA